LEDQGFHVAGLQVTISIAHFGKSALPTQMLLNQPCKPSVETTFA
jgi:hypothetical protein